MAGAYIVVAARWGLQAMCENGEPANVTIVVRL
jgi:hypothetical protein